MASGRWGALGGDPPNACFSPPSPFAGAHCFGCTYSTLHQPVPGSQAGSSSYVAVSTQPCMGWKVGQEFGVQHRTDPPRLAQQCPGDTLLCTVLYVHPQRVGGLAAHPSKRLQVFPVCFQALALWARIQLSVQLGDSLLSPPLTCCTPPAAPSPAGDWGRRELSRHAATCPSHPETPGVRVGCNTSQHGCQGWERSQESGPNPGGEVTLPAPWGAGACPSLSQHPAPPGMERSTSRCPAPPPRT